MGERGGSGVFLDLKRVFFTPVSLGCKVSAQRGLGTRKIQALGKQKGGEGRTGAGAVQRQEEIDYRIVCLQ